LVKKTLGYVELEWTCPKCGTRNPGPQKSCSSCGSPQPRQIEFQQAAQEELITDQAEIARVQAGPDVHCAFCGARNPAGAQRCSQCNADLSSATARESGRVLGAYRSGPAEKVTCPQCGALNDANALKCSQCNASLPRAGPQPRDPALRSETQKSPPRTGGRGGIIGLGIAGIALLALVAIGACLLITRCVRTQDVMGQVQAVEWTRSIGIEELGPVTRENWRTEIPSGARVGQCAPRHHHTQDDPAPGATEVCGTPYVLDTGTGRGQVVQDCQYEVYADWCTYTVQEWQQVDEPALRGSDLNPRWPDLALGTNQRQGERKETYKVTFGTEKGRYTYTTSSAERFAQCTPGSRWVLKVNGFNAISGIEPAQ
jgi:ribosomal protein L40E